MNNSRTTKVNECRGREQKRKGKLFERRYCLWRNAYNSFQPKKSTRKEKSPPLCNRIIKISIEARRYSMRISISFSSQIEFRFFALESEVKRSKGKKRTTRKKVLEIKIYSVGCCDSEYLPIRALHAGCRSSGGTRLSTAPHGAIDAPSLPWTQLFCLHGMFIFTWRDSRPVNAPTLERVFSVGNGVLSEMAQHEMACVCVEN